MNQLYVGYARTDITPEKSVPLRGYGNTSKRMSQNILDPLKASATVFRDEAGRTTALVALDLTNTSHIITDRVKENVKAFGIAPEALVLSSSHTHSAPDYINAAATDYIYEYRDLLVERITQAIKNALDDLKPATAYSGTTYTDKMNFVRHYRLEDGTYAGDNFGHFKLSPIVGHATEADNSMHILRFKREGGKDVIFVNWRAHPHKTGGSKKTDVSADAIHSFRLYTEEALDCHFSFFQGAAGNVNHNSRIKEETTTTDYMLYGKQLSEYVVNYIDKLTPCQCTPIRFIQHNMVANTQKSTPKEVEIAEKVAAVWNETGDYQLAIAEGTEIGIRSPYQANALIRRGGLPDTLTLELHGIAIGDAAFVSAPDELFDTYCKVVTDNSPFKSTMILCLANDGLGYIPSDFGYEYTCYESDTTPFARGTGEQLGTEFSKMLDELKSM